MNNGQGLMDLEDFYKQLREHLHGGSDAAQLGEDVFSTKEINSVAIPRYDGTQTLSERHTVPRRADGVPFRQIGGHGATQPLTYRGGLSILASRHPEFVACHTILHDCLTDYNNRGLNMIQQRGWRYATSGIMGPANVPFPFADAKQNLRFRVVNATMALNGRSTLAELGDSIMKLRFRDPEFVSHLLHSGMLQATDVDEVVTNEVEVVTTPYGIQTERCDGPTHILGTWTTLPTKPAAAELNVAPSYAGFQRPSIPAPSHRRVTSPGIVSPQPRNALSRSPTPEPVYPGYQLVDRFVQWTPPTAKTVPSASLGKPRGRRLRTPTYSPYQPSPLSRSVTPSDL
ncbi:hypothetical protein C8R47DRAFT_1111971 [Mycena vitilis]|nr:hypothetical protein C8R47DRAFT_1111971 [Mycena vitilis]